MSNHLKMATVQAILHLRSLHWSQRRIAAELDIDRRTVQRHLARVRAGLNAAISPAGSPSSNAATFPGLPAPAWETSDRAARNDLAVVSNAAIPPTGSKRKKGSSSPSSDATDACQE